MSEQSGFQVGEGAPAFYESHVGPFMAPFVDALVEATVESGASVLDVACGTGFATRAAAAVAGPGGRIVGTDINPAMLFQARSITDNSEAILEWSEASALDLPWADDEFDAVISQQGLQFFPDPAAALREMARVAKPGGRLGVTAWSHPAQTPFLDREFRMLERHAGAQSGVWTTTESELGGWFTAADLAMTSLRQVDVEVDLPDVSSYVPEHLRALPWSVGFFELPVDRQTFALAELAAELSEYRTVEGLRLPFSSYLAVATIGEVERR